ncbi:MAG: hypothetical protein B7Y80_09585 [Hyphomicrobium sp. 32-62-53]|nr:MAG: hypothetical protein B7Z29_09130 [Hyphomicrobium sp. 12-62-95]OYX99829.1 MAG: hypothetical protein B7Y80_09585 [Hyphomicrobium sp. 32-62-53]
MGHDNNFDAKQCLCHTLYQLRDDLGELLGGLESGEMTHEQVVAAARAELDQVLKVLGDLSMDGLL